ncbi:MAG: hypothetical protein ACON5H_01485 [Akkermansiaceae bacterium]
MNKRRQGSNLSISTLLVLLVAGIIVSGGGISYVMLKNKQITTRSEIAKIQELMAEHEVAISMYQSDISEKLGVFALRESLKVQGSNLRTIPAGYVEIYKAPLPPDPAVAQRE